MTATPATCPRCGTAGPKQRSASATPGVWTVFGCDTCYYTWRSTEPAENSDPAHYPPVFRLAPADIEALPVIPAIPPLRPKRG